MSTVYNDPLKDDGASLVLEEGNVLLLDRAKNKYIELETGEECAVKKERNQRNPFTIGREEASSLSDWVGIKKRKDIVMPRKYECASRKHCEIFYNETNHAFFLTDYSSNGTIVNKIKIGGKRQGETRRGLNHGDIIEIPAIGEKIRVKFLVNYQ